MATQPADTALACVTAGSQRGWLPLVSCKPAHIELRSYERPCSRRPMRSALIARAALGFPPAGSPITSAATAAAATASPAATTAAAAAVAATAAVPTAGTVSAVPAADAATTAASDAVTVRTAVAPTSAPAASGNRTACPRNACHFAATLLHGGMVAIALEKAFEVRRRCGRVAGGSALRQAEHLLHAHRAHLLTQGDASRGLRTNMPFLAHHPHGVSRLWRRPLRAAKLPEGPRLCREPPPAANLRGGVESGEKAAPITSAACHESRQRPWAAETCTRLSPTLVDK